MKILAIDTTTKFLCLGVSCDDKVYEYNLELARLQSSLLAVTIQRVLGALNWRLDDIDYFACGLGPGSFTGLRIGLATISGIAWCLKKPLIGISSLDILAQNANIAGLRPPGNIAAVIDAKRNLIYCGIYKDEAGKIKKAAPYLLISCNELIRRLKSSDVILGDALILYKEEILKSKPGITCMDKDFWRLNPHNMIKLAKERIKQKEFNSAFNIKPIYLYPKECQIKKA